MEKRLYSFVILNKSTSFIQNRTTTTVSTAKKQIYIMFVYLVMLPFFEFVCCFIYISKLNFKLKFSIYLQKYIHILLKITGLCLFKFLYDRTNFMCPNSN